MGRSPCTRVTVSGNIARGGGYSNRFRTSRSALICRHRCCPLQLVGYRSDEDYTGRIPLRRPDRRGRSLPELLASSRTSPERGTHGGVQIQKNLAGQTRFGPLQPGLQRQRLPTVAAGIAQKRPGYPHGGRAAATRTSNRLLDCRQRQLGSLRANRQVRQAPYPSGGRLAGVKMGSGRLSTPIVSWAV